MLSLIVNPAAGGGRAGKVLPAVQDALRRHGLAHHVERTRSVEHAHELALLALGAGEVAVALGGDGLVRALAGALKHTPGVLGVLPGGRGNDFARVLGIPLEPVAACAVLADGHVRVLDLGQAGERTFVSIASCGFDSVANQIANQTRIVRGSLVYTYAALRGLIGWKPARFDLRLDGEAHSFVGFTVAVANSGAYGGGMLLAPDAQTDDGMFDVVLIKHVARHTFLRGLPKVYSGSHLRLPYVEVRRAREVEVRADREFTMFADGDPLAELPVLVSCLPGAISVLAPALS
jgi:YegS/Rv2252/BmrU family lipid kinase